MYFCVVGIHNDSGTPSGQLHYSQIPDPSAKLTSNNFSMETLESKSNWPSDDSSGTSKSFSKDENTESESITPQQVSDSDEAIAGSTSYSNKLAVASANVVSSIASTEESVTLETYNKEDAGVTVTTDEMTTNTFSDSLAATATVGGKIFFFFFLTTKLYFKVLYV